MTDVAVTELKSHVGVRMACEALGASQAGYWRRNRQSPAPPRPEPIPHRQRQPDRGHTRLMLASVLVSSPKVQQCRTRATASSWIAIRNAE